MLAQESYGTDDADIPHGLENCKPVQIQTIQEIENMFHVARHKLEDVMYGMEQEMKKGLLQNDGDNDLKMIPSFVTGHPTGYEKGTYLALELSGVDIYVCQVRLKGEGGKMAINQYQYRISDHLTAGEDLSVLIDYIVDCVADFQQRIDCTNDRTCSIGISIGLAVKLESLNKGVCLALEHGFDYPNAAGTEIVDLFHQRFHLKGLTVKVVAIANDAVCTLLAHAYQHPSTRMGIVHSTGTNCAYYDKISNMKGFLSEQHQIVSTSSEMVVNTEWCNFSYKHLPINKFDHILDTESNNKGIHAFEKMTAGMYLGELVRLILVDLVDQEALSFHISDPECLLRIPYQFDTSYMYVCESDIESLEDIRTVLEDMCKTGKTTLADREVVKRVCEIVGRRASTLLGTSIAGVIQYMVKDGIGLDFDERGFAIAISGEVYKDYSSFHPRVCETLKALIPDEVAAKLSVGIVKHSRVVGAAIVAMMAEKNNCFSSSDDED